MDYTDRRPMDAQIEDKLHHLENIPVDAIAKSNPDFPGMFLQETHAQLLDRGSEAYTAVVADYDQFRPEFLMGLANNPTTRSLALLAVGTEGVELMEKGKVPRHEIGAYTDRNGNERTKYEYFNCHHMFQKSARDTEEDRVINSADNLVLLNTYRSDNSRENGHHHIHGAILHPQSNLGPGEETHMYIVKPAFPIFPPTTQPFATKEEVLEHLHSLDPHAELPDQWAERIVAFSQACDMKPYQVPQEQRRVTNAFGAIYFAEDDESQKVARDKAAEMGEKFAVRYLPEGATVNGKDLPEGHVPESPMPIWDGVSDKITWPKGVEIENGAPVKPAGNHESDALTMDGYFEKKGKNNSYVAVITGESRQYGFERQFVEPTEVAWKGVPGKQFGGVKTWELPEDVILETKMFVDRDATPEKSFIKVHNGEMQEMTREEVVKELRANAKTKGKGGEEPLTMSDEPKVSHGHSEGHSSKM